MLMIVTGISFALVTDFWPLVVVAFVVPSMTVTLPLL